MTHIKGIRFDLPLVRWLGVILEPFSGKFARSSPFSPDELRETLDALAAKTLVLRQ